MPLAEALPALGGLRVGVFLALLQRVPARAVVHVQSRIASKSACWTGQCSEGVVAAVGIGHGLGDGNLFRAFDGVEPFLRRGGGGGNVA